MASAQAIEHNRNQTLVWMGATFVFLIVAGFARIWVFDIPAIVAMFVYVVYMFTLQRQLGDGLVTCWLMVLLNVLMFPLGAIAVGIMCWSATKKIRASASA